MQLKEFCEDSSAHGLKKIATAKSTPLKVFWAAIFIAAIAALVFHLFRRIESYVKFEHQEISFTEYNPDLEYPDVTVCNVNPFSSSHTSEEQLLKYNLLEAPFQEGGRCRAEEYDNVVSEGDVDRQYTEALATLAGLDTVANISHRRDDFILKCRFARIDCEPEDLKTFIDLQYYQCHTINLNNMVRRMAEMSQKSEIGSEYGLSLILYLDAAALTSDDVNEAAEYRLESSILNTAGARVVIHRTGSRPRLKDYGFDVSTGFSTAVALQPQVQNRLTWPYKSNCTDQTVLNNGLVYTQNDCFDLCVNDKVEELCGCQHVSELTLGITRGVPLCGVDVCNMTSWQCYYNVKYGGESDSECLKRCPRKCQENLYKERVSSAYWPGDDYQPSFYANLMGRDSIPILVKNLGPLTNETIHSLTERDLLRKNFLRLNVFMETFYVRNVEEKEIYELVVLLADFGGTLGLWAGISAISVIEFIEFAISYVKRKCKGKCRCKKPCQKVEPVVAW